MKARLNGHMARLGIAGALLALTACAGDANPVRDVAVSAGVGAQPKPAPGFVAASRPGELDYIRPGVATRAGKAKSADDVKAFEAQMEKTRAANESRARAARELGAGQAPGAAPNP